MNTIAEVVEVLMVEYYPLTLPFKPKNWMMCHQPGTLEEAVLMEAYALQRQELIPSLRPGITLK